MLMNNRKKAADKREIEIISLFTLCPVIPGTRLTPPKTDALSDPCSFVRTHYPTRPEFISSNGSQHKAHRPLGICRVYHYPCLLVNFPALLHCLCVDNSNPSRGLSSSKCTQNLSSFSRRTGYVLSVYYDLQCWKFKLKTLLRTEQRTPLIFFYDFIFLFELIILFFNIRVPLILIFIFF